MIVAIHQPNYLPWLGYFRKIAQADVFVFLDDVQFSKGSYTNRVQILSGGGPAWLTVPVSSAFGAPIDRVALADPTFPEAHLRRLDAAYATAAAYRLVRDEVGTLYRDLPMASLAAANAALVRRLATKMGLGARFELSSSLGGASLRSDDRLVHLVTALAPGGMYLSGRGGASYQDPSKFARAGIALRYADTAPAPYSQTGASAFVPGLSVLDAVFHLGFEGAAALVRA